jgi:hypothetical protein
MLREFEEKFKLKRKALFIFVINLHNVMASIHLNPERLHHIQTVPEIFFVEEKIP